jgi:hypothetical protein
MRNSSRSKKALAAGAAALVLTGGVAYAYWTTDGSGSGSAATAAGTDPLTVNQTTVVTPLYPGLAAQELSGTFDNGNPGPVYVNSVTASIFSVTQAVDAVGECTADDYALTDAVMTVGASVPAGDDVGLWTGAGLQFANSEANQDGCKGATVALAYAIS